MSSEKRSDGFAGSSEDARASETHVRTRYADLPDASAIANLHADSWRHFYRGAYSDDYLDGDIKSERSAVWSQRLAVPGAATRTLLVEDDTGLLLGFVHLVLDEHERWGSLIDNLHVTHDRRRAGLGKTLISLAAAEVVAHASHDGVYLWVQEQNSAAQRFYEAMGGTRGARVPISPPGGEQSRLTGRPSKIRFTWCNVSALAAPSRRPDQ